MPLRMIIEKNRRWLRFYSILACILGWLVVTWGLAHLVWSWYLFAPNAGMKIFNRFFALRVSYVLDQILFGIIVLLASQYFDFLLAPDGKKPKWLLTNGAKLLYFSAIVCGVIFVLLELERVIDEPAGITWTVIPMQMDMFLNFGIGILLRIGLAQGLRRTLPIIEESKSLV
jgi:hypothetical protein